MRVATDPRYRSARWKRTRLIVLARDGYSCWVEACPKYANVADHIDPVFEGMADSQFFDTANLRASCKRHNTARGVAARLDREMAGGVRPAPRRYSFGGVKSDASGGTRFFRGQRPYDVGSPGTELEFAL